MHIVEKENEDGTVTKEKVFKKHNKTFFTTKQVMVEIPEPYKDFVSWMRKNKPKNIFHRAFKEGKEPLYVCSLFTAKGMTIVNSVDKKTYKVGWGDVYARFIQDGIGNITC